MNKKIAEQLEFEAGDNNKEYKVEGICNNMVYARVSKAGYLPGFYYLVSWKGYLEDEITWKPTSTVQHFRKLVSTFHEDHFNKPTAIFSPMHMALPMAKRTTPPNVNGKRKCGRPVGSVRKKAKH